MEKKLKISNPDGPMGAFFVLPSKATADNRVKALVVIQEAFGVNHHIHEICRRYAAEGFVTIAPELFHREGDGLEFEYDDFSNVLPTFSKLTNDSIRTDIEASLVFLENEHGISRSQTVVIGYCVGGLGAMIAAITLKIAGAIAYYGGGMLRSRPGMKLSPIVQDFPKIGCPTLLFFGDRDQSIPIDDVKLIESALTSAKRNFELIIYPGAAHAFSNDDRPAYNPSATKAAWSKTLSWLNAI